MRASESSTASLCMLSYMVIRCLKGYLVPLISREAHPMEEKAGVYGSGSLRVQKQAVLKGGVNLKEELLYCLAV